MADIDIAVQQLVGPSGVTPTYTGSLSTSNTYHVPNDGKMWLHFKKSGASDCIVTFTTPLTIDGVDVANPTVTVPASTGDKMIGPFRPSTFNDGDQELAFTCDNVTGLTVAALKLA